MKRVIEFLIGYKCPSDLSKNWKKLEIEKPCQAGDNLKGCRECWANVEKHLESEAEKKNETE